MRTAASSGTGAHAQPIFQPVTLNVLPALLIVTVRPRMPGSVATPAEFWELCSRARSGFTKVPKERFNHDLFYHPNPGKTGAYHAEGGNLGRELPANPPCHSPDRMVASRPEQVDGRPIGVAVLADEYVGSVADQRGGQRGGNPDARQ